MNKWILVIFCVSFIFSAIAKEGMKKERLASKQESWVCVSLTKQCLMCSDGKKRIQEKGKWKEISLSDYECAKGSEIGKKKPKNILPEIIIKLKNCEIISDFCAVCQDGKFLSLLSGSEMSSDLYECATSPRTKQF